MENYYEYILSKTKIRMKPGVTPHIFTCQPDKQTTTQKTRAFSEIRARKRKISELLKEETKQSEEPESLPSTSAQADEVSSNLLSVVKCDVACQTRIRYFRSKLVQVSLSPKKKQDVATSPIKIPHLNMPTKEVRETVHFETGDSPINKRVPVETSDTDHYQPSYSGHTSSDIDVAVKKHEQNQFREIFIKIIQNKLRMYTGIPKHTQVQLLHEVSQF